MTRPLAHLAAELPSVEAAAAAGHKLFHLVVLALFERGSPMTLPELVERLAPVVDPPSGDLATSIQKAWHGLRPVLRGRDDRFTLDHDERALQMAFLGMRLLQPKPAAPESPPIPERAATQPLTAEELQAAFASGTSWRSDVRGVAAILDANGRAMTYDEVDAQLHKLVGRPHQVHLPFASDGRVGGIILEGKGNWLMLDHESSALPAMRNAVRKAARAVLETRAREANAAVQVRACQRRDEAQQRDAQARLATLSRALLRVFPGPEVRAATLIDAGNRTIRTFVQGLEQLPDVLRR